MKVHTRSLLFAASAISFVIPVLNPFKPTPSATHSCRAVPSSTRPALRTYTVSDFPNAQPFELTGEQVNRLLHGVDPSTIKINPKINLDPNIYCGWWRLIKHNDHIYVRGWVAAPSQSRFSQQTVEIDNASLVPENGKHPAEVSLRLDTLKFCSFYDLMNITQASGYAFSWSGVMDEKIAVTDIHLDQYAWEQAANAASAARPADFVTPPTQAGRMNSAVSAHYPVLIYNKVPKGHSPLQQDPVGTLLPVYPDEKPFFLDVSQFTYLLTGGSLNSIRVRFHQNDMEKLGGWHAVKHQGCLYLRGWVSADTSQNNAAGQFVRFYNSPRPAELGNAAKQISLRLGSFQYGPSGRLYTKQWYFTGNGFEDEDALEQEQVSLVNVHLDDHAWEKW